MAFDAFTQPRATFRPDGFTVGPRHAFMLDMDMPQNLRPALLGAVHILNEDDGGPLARLVKAHNFVSDWADRLPYSAILRLRAVNLAMQVFEIAPPVSLRMKNDRGQRRLRCDRGPLPESIMTRHMLALDSITPEQLSFERRLFNGNLRFRDDAIESVAKCMHQAMDHERLTLAQRTLEIAIGLGMTVDESRSLRSRLNNYGDNYACMIAAAMNQPQMDEIAEARFHRRAQRTARLPRDGLARTIGRT